MIPVDQTEFAPGNCFSACVASVLELPLEIMPHFMRAPEWLEALSVFCAEKNIILDFGTDLTSAPRDKHYILNGRGPRGIGHSVVALNGQIVHDPHPSRAGLTDEVWCWIGFTYA